MEDEQKKKLLVLSALILVLAAVWYVVLFGFPGGGGAPEQKADKQATTKKEKQKEKKKAKKAADEEKGDENGSEDKTEVGEVVALLDSLESHLEATPSENMPVKRNPFVFKHRPKTPTINWPDLQVTVIFSNSGDGTAVINGQAVSVGESLGPDGNVTVTEIGDNSVTVTYSPDGRELQKTLTLE